MPFANHRGQRIHFEVRGEGSTVVFQHGLLSTGQRWHDMGYVEALAGRHRVVTVDSLAHGQSDKPTNPALYGLEQRAGDLVAVLDAVGAEQAHLVGYSMGGWMATGVAQYHPERLASLTLGGWDPIGGRALSLPPDRRDDPPGVEIMIIGARTIAPQLVEWVTPDLVPALSACWEALGELDGGPEAIAALTCPVLLWCGDRDPVLPAVEGFARAHDLGLLTVPGDHMGAVVQQREAVVERLIELFG